MKKIVLIVVVVAGAVLSIRPAREAALPLLAPVAEPAVRILGQQVARVRDPVYRWSVKNEARGLLRELVERERSGSPLPRPADFQEYLRTRTVAEQPVTDRWGSPYYLLMNRDSMAVVSPGPDRRPGTEDDIRASVPRG